MSDSWHHYQSGGWMSSLLLYGPPLVAAVLVLWALLPRGPEASRGVYLWSKRLVLLALAWPFIQTILAIRLATSAVGGESVDPSQKARVLAEGISEAMNCTAWLVLEMLVFLPMLFLLRRRVPRDVLEDDENATGGMH